MSRENSVTSGDIGIRQNKIYQKWMVRLKIVLLLQRGIKERIENGIGARPLKNIPVAPIFAQIRMMAK